METILLQCESGVARVTMNRPERHNAFDETMVLELTRAFRDLGDDPQVRVIVLQGAGPSFSAGLDLEWMRAMDLGSVEENRASVERMAGFLQAVDRCPKPVVARVQGPALGGGCGLVCAADLSVAGPEALFGFPEIRLGILPAIVAPFAIRRLGVSQARARFLTGSRFGAEEALQIGMIHALAEDLDAEVGRVVEALLAGAPEAQADCKDLVRRVSALPWKEQAEFTVELATASRAAPEGREGMSAFLEKRLASWVPKE